MTSRFRPIARYSEDRRKRMQVLVTVMPILCTIGSAGLAR